MLILLFFIIGALQPVSKDKYDQAVDYVGWQVMDSYMQDYINMRPNRKAEQKGYETFKQQFPADTYSLENPPESEDVKQVLVNNDWSNAYKSLYQRIINWKSMYREEWNEQKAADYLKNQVENISLQSLGVEDSDYVHLQLTKAQLKDEIAQFFAPPIQEKQMAVDTAMPVEDDNAMTEDTDTQAAQPQSFSGMMNTQNLFSFQINIISIVLVLILLALLLYLFNMYKKMDERVDRHRKEINEINSELFVLKKKVTNAEKDPKLSGRLEALESKIEKIHYEQPDHHPMNQNAPANTERIPTAVAAPPRTEEFYLSTPNSDGTFNMSSMSSSYKPTASIYKFMVTEEDGESKAFFTVAEQYESIKDAISSPGSYLDPVCESVNAFSPSAKRIINLKPGRAYKKGDKWVVRPEDKAIIRYE